MSARELDNNLLSRVDPYVPEFMQRTQAEALELNLAVTRRGFMKLAGFAGGGLVLGVTLTRPRDAAAQDGATTRFEPNPYVQIRPDGTIVLFSKNPDVGQGVKTAMPMIVAEELDADWADVTVEQAVIDQELYGPQFAGGSTSIPMNWMSLRQAGATARAMLVTAAAEALDVPESELTTRASRVVHEASGRSMGYGELAERAADVPVPGSDSLELKPRSEWTLLGRRITGVDNEEIVTGKPLYGIDQRLPDMLYATYVKGPAIGARAESANLEHVRSLKGVHDAFILEHEGDPIGFNPAAPAKLSGVAIVANSTWAAFKARDELEVTWDESEASNDSWSEAVSRAQELAGRGEGETTLSDSGDVDGAFAQAATTVDGFYTYQYASHADLEPQNCTAWFKGDSIEVWAPTQTPQSAKQAVAAYLGLSQDKVTLHQLRGGGGFGRRLANDSVIEVAAISRRTGRPIKAQWKREDDMTFDYYRPGGFHSFRGAVDADGRLSGWQDHFITFTRNGEMPASSANLSPQEFPANVLENSRLTQSMIMSQIPTGPWRAPGSNAIAFAVQSFLHECAVAANRDHVEFLLEVMGEPRWLDPGNTQALNTERAANVIRLAAEQAGWGRSLSDGRGLGLAFHFSHAGHFAEVADVSVDSDRRLTVHNVTIAADIGPIVNMSGAENQCEGSVIDALSTLMGLEITFENGRVQQQNFDGYPILRMTNAPTVDVHFVDSDFDPTGAGEPALPPAAPAICNAIYAASGHRVRTMPLTKEGFSI